MTLTYPQVKRYADLYTGAYYNLLSYPMFYEFMPMDQEMPHEKCGAQFTTPPSLAPCDTATTDNPPYFSGSLSGRTEAM